MNSKSSIKLTREGIRYRKKRRFSELPIPDKDSNINKENIQLNFNIEKKTDSNKKRIELVINPNFLDISRVRVDSPNKAVLLSAYRSRLEQFRTMTANFNDNLINQFKNQLKIFCSKNVKNINKIKLTTLNLFHDEKVYIELIDYNLPVINYQILFFDAMISKTNLYDKIIDQNNPTISNLLLFYYGKQQF